MWDPGIPLRYFTKRGEGSNIGEGTRYRLLLLPQLGCPIPQRRDSPLSHSGVYEFAIIKF